MKFKKLFAFAAALLVIGSTNAYAENGGNPQINVSDSYAVPWGFAEVKIDIKNNPGISAFSINLSYDEEILEFADARCGNGLTNGTFFCNGSRSGNSIKAVWSNASDIYLNDNIAVIRFKVKNAEAETSSALKIEYLEFGNSHLEPVEIETHDGEIKIAREILPGDADENGIIDINDIVTLNLYLLDNHIYPLSSYTAEANCDMDGNGIVEITDSAIMINKLCGID